MAYSADESRRTIGGRDQAVVTLRSGDATAEVLPALGFNCVRWRIGDRDLLYCPPLDELAERPTRGGIPILFPFPNRIRDGRFTWAGKEHQLPLNDPAKKNAIHGFTPREPWGIVDTGSGGEAAWVEAAFPPRSTWTHQWAGIGVITLKVKLTATALQYTAKVVNYGGQPFPFGLGYHPYFAVTPDCHVQTPARARWELVDSLPTGRRLPVEGSFDLRQPRPVGEVQLDDGYTDLPNELIAADGMIERGRLVCSGRVLTVRTATAFRDLVVFTPPHRKAICMEPYTCPTDAIHLQEKEDVGWRVLPVGGRWETSVEFAYVSREA
jgi:aldose 1-epimerase